MGNNDLIDQYVATVRHQLRWRGDAADIADELDDHLRSSADSLIGQGLDPADAQADVTSRLGDPVSVSLSYASTGSRGLAVPTAFTRSAGTVGMVSAAAWSIVAFLMVGSYVAEQATGDWYGLPQFAFMAGASALLAAATTQVILVIALNQRHGGLGVLGIAGIAATCLGGAACLLAWFIPFWAGLFSIGWLLLAFPLLRRGIAPRSAVAMSVLSWPIAFATAAVLRALQVGGVDSYGDYPLANIVGLGIGAVLIAASLAALGRWLAREEPAPIPATTAA